MKPKSKNMTGKELATLRRITAKVDVESPRGCFVGILLGSATAAVMVLLAVGGGPTTMVYGSVLGIALRQSISGSPPVVWVWVDDRQAMVTLASSATCFPGDRIKLLRNRVLIGYRYRPALPRPCR